MTNTTMPMKPESAEHGIIQRRARHIKVIQVRNLTPFPIRDAFTSALSQPAQQPQFSSAGQLTDDLSALLSKKRVRKVSSTSSSSRSGQKWDDRFHDEGGSLSLGNEPRGRKKSGSRAQMSIGSIAGPGTIGQAALPPGSLHAGTSLSASLLESSQPTRIPSLPLPQDNTQTGLEKILGSRLVETFVAVTIPAQPGHQKATVSTESFSLHKPSKSLSISNSYFDSSNITPRREMHTPCPEQVPSKARSKINFRSKGATNSRPIMTTPPKPCTPETKYLSHKHRPLTNPVFLFDNISKSSLPDWFDTSVQILKVEIWGKLEDERLDDGSTSSMKRRWKENGTMFDNDDSMWKVIDEWLIDLNELVPLPEHLALHPSLLPSNTLLITMSPPDQTFYIPPAQSSASRSSTPSLGYASDPESDLRRTRHTEEHYVPSFEPAQGHVPEILQEQPPKRKDNTSGIVKKTADWKDLLKVVTLQSYIVDNESSLSEISGKIEDALRKDNLFELQHQISECQSRIEDISLEQHHIETVSLRVKHEIEQRSQLLQERRQMLSIAKQDDQRTHVLRADIDRQTSIEKNQLLSLQARVNSRRISLLYTLSNIFPIELYSPPDLLFTILDIPLPIPLAPTDPAPPLTLPAHKNVSDESVATALGYAAQLLHLLSAYLGKSLVYPITCIGSRSLIRDNISAMIGPRMFPLFSKGVDTYRFEYGVFLLNKDIELFMVERNLRALDMRHTLPNLKNLLLTLSHGEAVTIKNLDSPIFPISSLLDPETQSRESSPIGSYISTPRASTNTELPASGATTPTTTIDESKKARPFLDLAPFTEFLRSHYPSATRASDRNPLKRYDGTNEVEDTVRPEIFPNESSASDNDDRRTIRADDDKSLTAENTTS